MKTIFLKPSSSVLETGGEGEEAKKGENIAYEAVTKKKRPAANITARNGDE
jgi:hypothetical protein